MYDITKITLIKKEILREVINWVDFFELPSIAGVFEALPKKIETFLIDGFKEV